MKSEKILWSALVLFFFLGLYLLSFIVLVNPIITGVISRYTSLDYDFDKVRAVANYIDGFNIDGDIGFLSEREQRHLGDVRGIIRNLKIFSGILVIVLFLIFVLFKNRFRDLILIYRKYFRYILIGLPVVVLFLVLSFSSFFYLFHRLLFTNNLWLLSADDILIGLFPQKFFLAFFVLYNGLFLLVGWVLAKIVERTGR